MRGVAASGALGVEPCSSGDELEDDWPTGAGGEEEDEVVGARLRPSRSRRRSFPLPHS